MQRTPKEMISFLKKNGFERVKTNHGSHLKFRNPETGRTVTVPFHNKPLHPKTEKAILRQAGLDK